MQYDFTTLMHREGQDALALDSLGKNPGFAPDPPKEGFDVIPMWVADMNFPVLHTIPDAIAARLKQPHFGYFTPRDEYYDSIIQWHKTRNGVQNLTKENIGYENGVLGGVISAMNVYCSKGDKVLVHSPTYIGFTKCLTNNGYEIVHSPLVQDEQGVWRMDYEDMENKIREQKIHAPIFCSPHNPCGRVWEKWEIEKAMAIYEKYNVQVISDEIWSDIITTGHKHVPTQSVSEYARMHTVALYAPSKTFNLAGLIGSYHIIYNQYLRDRVTAHGDATHYNEMNVLSMHALIGAYSDEGREWVSELLQVLEGNCKYACDHIRQHYDGVDVSMPQGTYMLFLDLTDYCRRTGKTLDQVLKAGWDVGVGWQDGRMFHGPCHIRMNLASPLSRIQEAFHRLDKYVFNA